MVDVFISYKREDKTRAEAISRKLSALGLDVWLDSRIPSGTTFDAEIEGAVTSAKAVLVLWTPESVKSDWVRNEASIGKERGVLVALMLAPCELPVAFRSTQCEPLFQRSFADDDPSWIKTLERTKDLVGRRTEVDAKQRKVLGRRRLSRILRWLMAWPIGAALLFAGMIYALTPLQPVQPALAYTGFEGWDTGFVFAVGSIDMCSWMNERNSYRLVDGAALARDRENERAPYYATALIGILLAWSLFVLFRIVAFRTR